MLDKLKRPYGYEYIGDNDPLLEARRVDRCPNCSPPSADGSTGGDPVCTEPIWAVVYDSWYLATREFAGMIFQDALIWIPGGDSGNIVALSMADGSISRTIDIATAVGTNDFWEMSSFAGVGADGVTLFFSGFDGLNIDGDQIVMVNTTTDAVTTGLPGLEYTTPGLVDNTNGVLWLAGSASSATPGTLFALDQTTLAATGVSIAWINDGVNAPKLAHDTTNNHLWRTNTALTNIYIYSAVDGSLVTTLSAVTTAPDVITSLEFVPTKGWVIVGMRIGAYHEFAIYDATTYTLVASIADVEGALIKSGYDFKYVPTADEFLLSAQLTNTSKPHKMYIFDGTDFHYKGEIPLTYFSPLTDLTVPSLTAATDLNGGGLFVVDRCDIFIQDIYAHPVTGNVDLVLFRFNR